MRSRILRATSILLATLFAAGSAFGGVFGPSKLEECLLDKLPGAQNDTVAGEISSQCIKEYGDYARIEKKQGFFASYTSGRECTIAKARNTPSFLAARVIQYNCYRLYEPFDPSTVIPDEPLK
jgi:hypothetical protein